MRSQGAKHACTLMAVFILVGCLASPVWSRRLSTTPQSRRCFFSPKKDRLFKNKPSRVRNVFLDVFTILLSLLSYRLVLHIRCNVIYVTRQSKLHAACSTLKYVRLLLDTCPITVETDTEYLYSSWLRLQTKFDS